MHHTLVHLAAIGALLCMATQPLSAEPCDFDLYRVPVGGLGGKPELNPLPEDLPEIPLVEGVSFPDTTIFPHSAFRRLDAVVDRKDHRYCAAQFVGRGDVLLTAAHCVRDNVNGAWVENFRLHSLTAPDEPPLLAPRCIATPVGWVGRLPDGFPPRFNWADDYALVMLDQQLSDDVLNLVADVDAAAEVTAYGLPVLLGGHRKLVAVPGRAVRDAAFPTMGSVSHKQQGVSLGVSGGAWVVNPSPTAGPDANVVIGISSFARAEGDAFIVGGSYFDQCAARMLEFIVEQCGGPHP